MQKTICYLHFYAFWFDFSSICILWINFGKFSCFSMYCKFFSVNRSLITGYIFFLGKTTSCKFLLWKYYKWPIFVACQTLTTRFLLRYRAQIDQKLIDLLTYTAGLTVKDLLNGFWRISLWEKIIAQLIAVLSIKKLWCLANTFVVTT